MMPSKRLLVIPAALLCGALLISGAAYAQEVESALRAASATEDAERRAQGNIDQVVDETRAITRQYSGVLKEIEGLEVYIALLEKQIASQTQEMADLNASIDQVSVIERQVTPLMLRMVDGLDQFVELDVPFLIGERRQRVTFLRSLLERSDVTVAEKVRRVLEAYEIENDYGRTIEAYKGTLELDSSTLEVDFLRVGRVGLLYQSVDGEVFGMWDQQARDWSPLAAEYRNQIRAGIKIARRQVAPNLLLLPVAAPEVGQ